MLQILSNAVGPIRMPLLAFLSGLIAHYSLQKPLGDFTRGKVRNLAWPYVVWSIIFWTLELTFRDTIYGLTDYRLYISYLWYLGYIFTYYFISKFTPAVPRVLLASVAFSAASSFPGM